MYFFHHFIILCDLDSKNHDNNIFDDISKSDEIINQVCISSRTLSTSINEDINYNFLIENCKFTTICYKNQVKDTKDKSSDTLVARKTTTQS